MVNKANPITIGSIKIVMLVGKGFSTRVMFHALKKDVDIIDVILEEKPSSWHLLRRRVKKLGLFKVSGQVLFILFNKFSVLTSASRISELSSQFILNDKEIPKEIVHKVKSINSQETIKMLQKINPDAVVVNGTRIISKKVLASVTAPFINTHMGITPKYRGIHCGYWALAMNDKENCGVTVHLVDEGIDTGGVLFQSTISPNRQDNFNTYPVHQIAAAIPLMKKALIAVSENRSIIKKVVGPSRLWYHPTLWGYLWRWVYSGVK